MRCSRHIDIPDLYPASPAHSQCECGRNGALGDLVPCGAFQCFISGTQPVFHAEADKPLLKQVEELGVTVTSLAAQEREAFVKATRPVFDKWKAQIGPDLVDKAEDAIAARAK